MPIPHAPPIAKLPLFRNGKKDLLNMEFGVRELPNRKRSEKQHTLEEQTQNRQFPFHWFLRSQRLKR
jgi:hypothetical protein